MLGMQDQLSLSHMGYAGDIPPKLSTVKKWTGKRNVEKMVVTHHVILWENNLYLIFVYVYVCMHVCTRTLGTERRSALPLSYLPKLFILGQVDREGKRQSPWKELLLWQPTRSLGWSPSGRGRPGTGVPWALYTESRELFPQPHM